MVYGSKTSSLYEGTDFLAGIKPSNVIPNYASVNEMMYYVIESCEQDYNNMMMNIGISELNHFEETGMDMIYEGSSNDTIIDKAVNLFRKMWSSVQDLIQRALTKLAGAADKIRTTVINKIGKKALKKRADGLKADRDMGSSYKNYIDASFKIKEYSKKYYDELESYSDKVTSAYQHVVDSKNTDNAEEVGKLESTLKGIVNDAVKSISPKESYEGGFSSLGTHLKEDMRGDSTTITGAWVKANWDDLIVKEAESFSTTKDSLKKEYNTLKKFYNKKIAEVKKANNEHFKANAFTKTITAWKQLMQIGTVIEQSCISCYTERHSAFRSIIIKVAGSKPVKESATFGSTTDAIDSLFNW